MFSKKKSSEVSSDAKHQGMPSLVTADVTITGNVSAKGEIQIDGIVEGSVIAEKLVVGSHATIRGEVTAKDITIKGLVDGPIRGIQVKLDSGCKVTGDIIHSALAVENGAEFEGTIRRSDDPMDAPKRLAAPEASAKPAAKKPAKPRASKAAKTASESASTGKAGSAATPVASAAAAAAATMNSSVEAPSPDQQSAGSDGEESPKAAE